MVFPILFYAFIVVSAVQIVYYFFFSFFAFESKKTPSINKNIPISVIVYTKNNASILKEFLSKITKQKHPDFEIVIINNASTDNTLAVLEELTQNYSNLKIVDVQNNEAFWGNKKYALTLGIKAAKHKHLLFTDVNTLPISKDWITTMANNFSKEKSIVIGYQKLKRKKRSLSNLFLRFHHLTNTMQAFSGAKFGNAYKGFNSNFAFTKAEFFKVNGYIKHLKLFIGETDLFIKDASTKHNTTYSVDINSFASSTKIVSFNQWFAQQKTNAILTASYKPKHKFLLNFYKISKFLFYILAIISLFFNWKITLPVIISYYLVQYIVVGKTAVKLKENTVLWLLPFFDLSLVIVQISIFISNQISKPKHWK